MDWHRQREQRRKKLPSLLFIKDHEEFRTKAGIDRAVLDALRRFGILPPQPPSLPPLRLVKDDDGK